MSSQLHKQEKKPKQTAAQNAAIHAQAKLDRQEAKRQDVLREISASHIRETTGFYLDTTTSLHKKQFGNMPLYNYKPETSPQLLKTVLKR